MKLRVNETVLRNGSFLTCVLLLSTVVILPATADEILDRRSFQTVSDEVYHVLEGVRWYDGEGGSYLFNRLDGMKAHRTWFVDFLVDNEAAGYGWPENCHIGIHPPKPGSGENVMAEGWLEDHDAILRFPEAYPVSGFDIDVIDTLASGSEEQAALLVMGMESLFEAPMMANEKITWSFDNHYDAEQHTLNFSVNLVTPYGIPCEWVFDYRRNPETGDVTDLSYYMSSNDVFGYDEVPKEAYSTLNLAYAFAENFNNLLIYRLFNYLNIYHTEKWPAYTLNYPDVVLRRSTGERGGGCFYSIELEPGT